jgi:hypothetical protein
MGKARNRQEILTAKDTERSKDAKRSCILDFLGSSGKLLEEDSNDHRNADL